MRPSSRNSAFGKYREEQSRPARPRLSRDAVDRAWENGATRTYADYHPRQNPPTSPAQRQGRPAPAYERSRQPQNRRPYDSSQENYGSPRPSARPGGYQPRQYNEEGPRRFDRPGYRAPAGQPGLNNERWTRNAPPPSADGYNSRRADNRPPRFQQDGSDSHYRGANRPPRFQQDGPEYRGTGRAPRFQQDTHEYRGNNQRRPFENNGREREQFAHGQRNGGPGARRDNYNPRWQSRPGPQRDYANQQRDYQAPWQDTPAQHPGRAQFEGDYERFTDYERAEPQDHASRPAPAYERPVTRLPDGRVLHGSRPSQRKQARFWNEVENETSSLIEHTSAHPEQEVSEPAPQAAPVRRAARPPKAGASGPQKVKTVKTARADDVKPRSAKVARKNAQGPRKPVTRPSRRGYKWPTAGEQTT